MATAPPTGGAWRAWYARLWKLIEQYHDRTDEAGRFARRLLREMDSLWVFWYTTVSTRRTTGRSAPCDVVSCGANARWERPVAQATGGWSASCRSRRPAISTPRPPTPCWWTPSAVSSMADHPTCPGSMRG